VLGGFRGDHLSNHACPSNTTAYRTQRAIRGYHIFAVVRAGIPGQNVDLQLKTGRDEIQYTRLHPHQCSLGFVTIHTDLFGLGDIALKLDLRQHIVIRLA
jgi:hypothetical protein